MASMAWTTGRAAIRRRAIGILGVGQHPAGAKADAADDGQFGYCFHMFVLCVERCVEPANRELFGDLASLSQFTRIPEPDHLLEAKEAFAGMNPGKAGLESNDE